MKKLSSLKFGVCLLTFVCSLFLIQLASATTTLPFYDGFASSLTPDGGVLTNVDATWTNTAGSPNIIVGSAYAQSYAGLQTPASGSKGAHLWNGSSAAAGVQIATTATSGSVYASFLLKVTTNTTGSRVIFEMNTSSGGAVSTPPFGVALNSDTTLSLFKTLLITNKTSALTVGTTYFVVVRYNFIGSVGTDDTMDLWLNPDASTFGPIGTPPTATIAGVGAGNTDASGGFRTVNFGLFTSGAGAYDFDEVRAGTAWADVTPIDVAAATYYRSRQSGAWSDYNTWNRSTDGVTFSFATAGQIPTNTDYVTNLVGHAVTVSTAAGAAALTVRGTLTLGANVLTASQVAVDGGILDVTTNNNSIIGAVTLLNGGHINGTSGTLSGTGYTMATGTAAANLGGASAALAASGTLALNGTNTYGGATTVSSGGILQLGNGSALGATNVGTTVSSGGLLDLNGQTIGAEPLSIAGGSTSTTSLTNSSATAASWSGLVTLTGTTYVGGAGNLTLSGGIAQNSSTARNLGKLNENTLTLSGPSTYLGVTTIRAGTVRVAAPSSLSPGQLQTGGSTADTSTLDLASPGAYGMTNLSLGGIIHATASGGAASLTFSNDSLMTGSGSKTVDAGTNVTVYFGGSMDLYGSTSATNNRNLNIQGAGAVVFNGAITNTGYGVSTNIYGLHVLGTGTATINGMNTYNGNTTIDGGRLIFGSGATIPNSTNISLAAGAVLDVSAGGYVLGANRNFGNNQNNTNAVGAGIVSGSLNASAGAVSLYYTNGVSSLLVSNGTFTLAANTPVTVTSIGTALGAGSYPLIANGTGGSVVGTAPTNLTVGPGGLASGATAALSISNNELYLVVSGGTLTAPVIGGFASVSGGGVALNFSGPSGQTWKILTSTNVTLPVASWSTVTSGTFGAGAVNYTNNSPADPQRFYRVTSP